MEFERRAAKYTSYIRGRGSNIRRKERGGAVVSSGLTLAQLSSSLFVATKASPQALSVFLISTSFIQV